MLPVNEAQLQTALMQFAIYKISITLICKYKDKMRNLMFCTLFIELSEKKRLSNQVLVS